MGYERLKLGTYRIINGQAGTAIQVLDHDPTRVVAWERHGGENQQWFLQPSGDGYRFKNRRHGTYLAVSSTDEHSLLHGSKYPTTWVLFKTNDCYTIQFPGNHRVFDLHYGLSTNGNEIHLWPASDERHRTWRFEHLSDETGEVRTEILQEEKDRLRHDLNAQTGLLSYKERELIERKEELIRKQTDISERDKELARLRDELTSKEIQLSEQCALASQREATIRQLQEILKAKDDALAYAYKSNEETAYLRGQQSHVQTNLSQQQNETAGLQAKMDRLEYLMSQLMNKDGRSYHNLP